MHVWVNGPFGIGKSSAADELARARPGCRHFDAEQVGSMLTANLADIPLRDFQDLPSWRRLVPIVAGEVAAFTGQSLVIVQTVLDEECWRQLSAGLRSQQLDVVHVVLDAPAATVRWRIDDDDVVRAKIAAGLLDPHGVQWRLDHIAAYMAARSWLHRTADLVVDVTELDVAGVAAAILDALPTDWCRAAVRSR